eukprot:m.121509 g.121509  ORF g.121509 m.121509 type:complete len:453 (+) comp15641_c0_seq1:158-1516(+)
MLKLATAISTAPSHRQGLLHLLSATRGFAFTPFHRNDSDEQPHKDQYPADAPVLVLSGPAACNTQQFAVRLAAAFNGEIISADAAQIYKDLPVGTQQLSPARQADVQHHFVGIRPLSDYMSAGLFAVEARKLCKDILSRGKLPIVTGSSVFYLRNMLDGQRNTPPRDVAGEEEIAARLRALSWDDAVHEVSLVDPQTAAKALPNDWHRLVRAVSVFERAGKPIGDFVPEKSDLNFRCAYLTMDKDSLRSRIASRCEYIIASGLIEETVKAMTLMPLKQTRLPSFVGYRHVLHHFDSFWFEDTSKTTLRKRKAFHKMLKNYIVASRRVAAEQLRFLRRDDSRYWAYSLDEYGSEEVALQDFADFLNAETAGDLPTCFFREPLATLDTEPVDMELEIYSDPAAVDLKMAEVQSLLIATAKQQGWPVEPLLDDEEEEELDRPHISRRRRRYLAQQ